MDIAPYSRQSTLARIFEGVKNFIEESLDYLMFDDSDSRERRNIRLLMASLLLITTFTVLYRQHRRRREQINFDELIMRNLYLEVGAAIRSDSTNTRMSSVLDLETHRLLNPRVGLNIMTSYERYQYEELMRHVVDSYIRNQIFRAPVGDQLISQRAGMRIAELEQLVQSRFQMMRTQMNHRSLLTTPLAPDQQQTSVTPPNQVLAGIDQKEGTEKNILDPKNFKN